MILHEIPDGGTLFFDEIPEVEAEPIRDVLESVNGTKTRAAEILGIDRKTLPENIRKLEYL